MKHNLIDQYCTTRIRIDKLAIGLGISKVGSRQNVLDRISNEPYSKIKSVISKLTAN